MAQRRVAEAGGRRYTKETNINWYPNSNNEEYKREEREEKTEKNEEVG